MRVTRDGRSAKEVAKLIIHNRHNKVEYNHKYDQLKTRSGKFISSGDTYRYAGDILDYMVLANLLDHKGTGYYYSLNNESMEAINFHLKSDNWFDAYDKFYGKVEISNQEVGAIEEMWFDYVNSFDNISSFEPKLDEKEAENISALIQEYYTQMDGGKSVPTKIIGDYGETLILAHEYLRTKDKSNRQHLINKIPTPLGVGYDLQSIEIEKKKRYIEVKTTKSKKAITNNRFKLTPNEWDTAETLQDNYFVYYLIINEKGKRIFVIQNPFKQYALGNIKIDKNLVVEFSKTAGKWQKLLEIKH